MVDEAKQEENLEPTPYQNAYKKDLHKEETDESKIVEESKTEQKSETTSFLESEKKTKQQEHDFKKR